MLLLFRLLPKGRSSATFSYLHVAALLQARLHTACPSTRLLSTQSPPIRREKVLTVPNVLSLSRIAASPLLFYLITSGHYKWSVALFMYCGITDAIDGYVARRFKDQKTVLGSILDPAADKVLVGSLAVALTCAGLLPVPLALLILVRDAGLVVASCLIRYRSLLKPVTFKRYFDFSISSIEVKPTSISKINTAMQLVLLGSTLLSTLFDSLCLLLPYLQWTTAATTATSGLSYIFANNAIRFIKGKNST